MNRSEKLPTRAARLKQHALWCSLWLAWVAMILGGFYALSDYELRPGLIAEPPDGTAWAATTAATR